MGLDKKLLQLMNCPLPTTDNYNMLQSQNLIISNVFKYKYITRVQFSFKIR
jgi:hypothetical protein